MGAVSGAVIGSPPTAVPEPSGPLLFGAGILVLLHLGLIWCGIEVNPPRFRF